MLRIFLISMLVCISFNSIAQLHNIEPYSEAKHVKMQSESLYSFYQYILLPLIPNENKEDSTKYVLVEWIHLYGVLSASREISEDEFVDLLFDLLSRKKALKVSKAEYVDILSRSSYRLDECQLNKKCDFVKLLDEYFTDSQTARYVDGCVFANLILRGYIIYRDPGGGSSVFVTGKSKSN